MKRLAAYAILLFTAACSPGPLMTDCVYEDAQVGDLIQEVVDCAGDPYCITEMDKGLQQYVYTRRFDVGTDLHIHRNYVFVVDDDGIIVDRWICEDESRDFFFEVAEKVGNSGVGHVGPR